MLSTCCWLICQPEDFRTPEEKKFDRDLKKSMKKKSLKQPKPQQATIVMPTGKGKEQEFKELMQNIQKEIREKNLRNN